jgi:hypothetical protein
MKSPGPKIDPSWTHRFWRIARRMAVNRSKRTISKVAAMASAGIAECTRELPQSWDGRSDAIAIPIKRE